MCVLTFDLDLTGLTYLISLHVYIYIHILYILYIYIKKIYIYIWIYMVFTTEGFFEVALESWPE